MTGLLIKLIALITVSVFLGLGAVVLRRDLRRGGGGPSSSILFLIAAGSSLAIAASQRDFLTGEALQTGVAVLISQAATAALLLIAFCVIILRVPVLFRPAKDMATGIWASFLAYFAFETVASSIFGTVGAFPIGSLYSVLIFTAVFVRPPVTEQQIAHAAKAPLIGVLYLSALMAVVAPSSVIEQGYEGLLPGLDFRYHGATAHANVLGPLALAFLIVEYAYPSRMKFRIVNTLIALLTLVLAQSKTAWLGGLGFFAVFLYYGLIAGSAHRASSVTRTAAKGVLLLVLPALIALVAQQVLQLVELSGKEQELSTFTGRTIIWQITFEKFQENPLFGYGPTLWSEDFRLRYHLPYVGQAHNQFLQTLGSGGGVGIFGLAVYLSVLVWAAIRHAKVTKGATLAFLVMFLVHCLSESPMRLASPLSGGSLLHLTLFAWLVLLCRNRRSATPARWTKR